MGGRGPRPPVKFLPPVAPKKFKVRPSLAKIFRKLGLLCISCHFNAFTFCDILMTYVTY